MGVTTRIGVAMGEVRESEGSPRILFHKRQNERQQQGIGESSSATSTFAIRDDAGTRGERRERMGVTARIGVAMGEVRVGASRRAQQLRESMKWMGDEAKRWLWRDAG